MRIGRLVIQRLSPPIDNIGYKVTEYPSVRKPHSRVVIKPVCYSYCFKWFCMGIFMNRRIGKIYNA